MGHGVWGMGHGAWGLGHGARGKTRNDKQMINKKQ